MNTNTLNLRELQPIWQQLQVALTPIQNDEQHEQALQLLEPIWKEVGEKAHHPLGSLLTLMVERIQAYEDERYPMLPNDPARMLAYLIELRGISQRELAEATGIDQGNISRLLSRKREFTPEQMRRLGAYFKVDPSLFL